MRVHSLQADGTTRPLADVLTEVITQYRPLPHVRNLEDMDLYRGQGVHRHLVFPDRYKALSPEELESRLDELKRLLHIEQMDPLLHVALNQRYRLEEYVGSHRNGRVYRAVGMPPNGHAYCVRTYARRPAAP